MESIEQMIKRLCPEGVKYVKLGDICEIRRGVRVVKKQLGDGAGYPVYQKKMMQWSMRITAYSERLLQGLDTLP